MIPRNAQDGDGWIRYLGTLATQYDLATNLATRRMFREQVFYDTRKVPVDYLRSLAYLLTDRYPGRRRTLAITAITDHYIRQAQDAHNAAHANR